MRRIAHLSDVHMLDSRAGSLGARYRFATSLVNLGQRALDPHTRVRRLARALRSAKENGADHIVISGDLTEVGEAAEFERFAEVLHDARLPEDSITLVPGNHDLYTRGDAWARALRGPLARFAAASAAVVGKVVERGRVVFLPVDTTRFQTLVWSGGVFTEETAGILDRRAADPAFRDKTLVLVMHHPPFHPSRTMNWWDGLRGGAHVLRLLVRHPRLALFHGHLHRIFDHALAAVGGRLLRSAEADGRSTRVFGAPATCDASDDGHSDEVRGYRLYDLVDGALRALDRFDAPPPSRAA